MARVVGHRDVGGAMALVALDVPDAIRASYVRPGQYAHFTVGSDGGYFVLGSREGRSPWEILLRRGGGVADALHAAHVGQEVDVTNAIGAGYPVDRARGEEVVLVVTAGAMAAARATVGKRIDDGDAERTHLLVGARTMDSVPVRDEIEAMQSAGVTVRFVLSPRYVQHVLEQEWKPGAWIFIAGADAMIADVRHAALALGASAERVVSNV